MSASDTPQIWCLWQSEKGVMLKGLSVEQLEAVCQATAVSEVMNWFVWCEGWEDWKRAIEVAELSVMPRGSTLLPPQAPVGGVIDLKDKKIVSRANQEKAVQQRRRSRFVARYGIEIINSGRSFKSFSQDISVGGLRIEDTLPDWIAGYCSLILTHPASGEQIEFVVTIVENQEISDKTRLEFQPSESLVRLEEWLLGERISS